MLIPNKYNGYSRDGRRLYYFDMGNDQPTTPEKTTQVSELPEWAKGYAKDTLAKGAALTDINQNPYKQYGGERIAGFQPLQTQAMKTIGGLDAGPEGFQKNMSSYMSPYMQNVVDIQKREAGRQSGILGQQIAAKGVQSGAFGGSRQALQTAERDRNLAEQMNDIQARGSQAAYDSASNQFRQGITQQSGLAQMQGQMGAQQQQQAQRPLDMAYQDFLNQQNYPYKQLGFMSDMIRGLPLGQQSTSSIYSAPPSLMGQLGGLGMGAYGLSKMMADGGLAYADGGKVTSQGNKDAIVGDMYSIEGLQIAKEAALNRRDMDTVAAIDERIAQLNALAQSASLSHGLGSAFDNLPTEQQENVMSAANGGIVAFADEGAVDLEKIQREKDRAALGQAYEDFKKGARKTGAAAMDIGTLPFRAIAGAGESVITRPLRALGVDVPYLPESYYGGDASSMTPYMDKLRREEGYSTGLMDPFYSTEKKSTAGAGRGTYQGYKAEADIKKSKPTPKEKPEPKQKKVSPTIDKAITKMAEEQGVPKEDFMDMYDKVRGKLQAESKEDLKGLQDLIDKQSGKSKEIKEKALGKALAEFGFNMAAQASKTGKESKGQGISGLLGSAAAASPVLAASVAESEKLAAAADENDMKLQIEMRKFSIASRKNDSATAMSAAQNMRILQQQQETIKQQQRQLDETIRHNTKTENLMGARIGASGNAYNTALLRTKANLAVNAQKEAAKAWSDPFKSRELKTQYPSQKAYEKSLFNDMWSQAMPQLELIGTKSAED
jgi:hypothetical protein